MAKVQIQVSDWQKACLLALSRAGNSRQSVARRSRVVLLAHEGKRSPAIAQALGMEVQQVRRWRRRWESQLAAMDAAESALVALELSEPSEKKVAEARRRFEEMIEEVMTDAPRPGVKRRITTEQWCAIIEVACEPPAASNRPITHWTARELLDEVLKRKIVETLSVRHLARFFGGHVISSPQSLRLGKFPGQRHSRVQGAGEGIV